MKPSRFLRLRSIGFDRRLDRLGDVADVVHRHAGLRGSVLISSGSPKNLSNVCGGPGQVGHRLSRRCRAGAARGRTRDRGRWRCSSVWASLPTSSPAVRSESIICCRSPCMLTMRVHAGSARRCRRRRRRRRRALRRRRSGAVTNSIVASPSSVVRTCDAVVRIEQPAGVDVGLHRDVVLEILDFGDAADQEAVLADRRVRADARRLAQLDRDLVVLVEAGDPLGGSRAVERDQDRRR